MRTNTMPTIGFDTLKFVKALVSSGMPTSQAEALAKEQNELLSYQFDQLATKSDVKQIQAEIKHVEDNMDVKFQSLQAGIKHVENNLRVEMKHLAENTQADIKRLAENTQADLKHLTESIQADLGVRLARLQLQLMLAFFGGLTTAVGIVLSAIKMML